MQKALIYLTDRNFEFSYPKQIQSALSIYIRARDGAIQLLSTIILLYIKAL